ncbi:excalibur calcium-binding domain-containing protein [Mesorhizobium australicum]|uniref:excalibur calcium-binding domain-containing protein n=1 Tax=Mesorhizobium australicum TaxID=536018 RepID=UPI0033393617
MGLARRVCRRCDAAEPAARHCEPQAGRAERLFVRTRRYCSQIGSCDEAQWYLHNCSWGRRLDHDNDGVACETLC